MARAHSVLTRTTARPAAWAALLLCLFALAGCGAAGGGTPIAAACGPLTRDAFVWVPPSMVTIGDDRTLPEEAPARQVAVAGFWLGAHEVTNAEFAAFVRATGYRTLAERTPPPLAGAPPEMLEPGSAVFTRPTAGSPQWWRWVPGAMWRHPAGPDSSIAGRDRHPVVQVAYDDALAYARWAGKALPSEEQWEAAARAGGADPREPVDAAGAPTANYYQGVFPVRDLARDGYRGTAPVGCFPASRIGTYDMIGNVWEWTRDTVAGSAPSNVIKGGSYLCAANYCARYRPAARQFQERSLGTDHIGFRLIDPDRPPPPTTEG